MQHRNYLPQLGNKPFITDGGLETTLVFHRNLDLPCFAAFTLFSDVEGREILRSYFAPYIALAQKHKTGLIMESATWRANSDWGARLGYTREDLHAVNLLAVSELATLREEHQRDHTPIVISGNIGPRGDGYAPANRMTEDQAESYHQEQIATFAASDADMVCAMTINYIEEAIGIVRAARNHGMPVCISFTVETDGRLPTGDSLETAITEVDKATSGYPQYFMVNCAHPTHFQHVLTRNGPWRDRIYGVRANASMCSHSELDNATTLDMGDPHALANDFVQLKESLPRLRIFGGCCGTDHRHIQQMCEKCL